MRMGLEALTLAAVLASGPVPAAADGLDIHVDIVAGRHRHDDRRYGRRGRGYRNPRYAWQRGYERGLDHGYDKGRKDARKHHGYDPWRHSRFRKASSGYRSRFGPRPAYRDGYRDGFLRAYDRGFETAHRRRGRHDRCYDGRRGRRW